MATDSFETAPAVLGTWPTPLEAAPRMAQALGLGRNDLWIKRDDLTGLGGGGNKVRKLEWICGAAVARGADTLVTCGARQSNHARLTAAAGARLGLDVVLVLAGTKGGPRTGNIALDGLLGATVTWAGDIAHEDLETIALGVVDQLRARGARPEFVPYGGSSALGARGYVECGHELLTAGRGPVTRCDRGWIWWHHGGPRARARNSTSARRGLWCHSRSCGDRGRTGGRPRRRASCPGQR